MAAANLHDSWNSAEAYQRFMGRWSPRLAELFVPWLGVADGQRWLDVGCGTGALTRAILALAAPSHVVGIEPSEAFVEYARQHTADPRASFEVGSAQALPVDEGSFDVAAAGLVLNFVPSPEAALAEMARCVGRSSPRVGVATRLSPSNATSTQGGVIGAYVWDYAEGMQMVRVFFDAATALDPAAKAADEGRRFEMCNPEGLTRLFESAGLHEVQTRALEFTMQFRDFDDYWDPFKGGVGPAPSYLASLSPTMQAALESEVRDRLPINTDGSVQLTARAWAVKAHL